MSDDEYSTDSTDGETEEEKAQLSLEYKKSRLFRQASAEKEVKKPAVGKLNKWEPISTR